MTSIVMITSWLTPGRSEAPPPIIVIHRLPNGVRTNVLFAEAPQYTMVLRVKR